MNGLMKKMRTLTFLLIFLCLILVATSGAQGAMVFSVDFAQDGVFENTWRLRPGESVSVDIYVSNVPEPGLRAMGFKLTYDASKLQVVQEGTGIDSGNWLGNSADFSTPGEIQMAGFQVGEEGLSGDTIKLGTVQFHYVSSGASEIMLLDRGETVDGFVLTDGTVLDGDLGDGVLLGKFVPVFNPGTIMLLLDE
jgi:hypothetical protein